MIVDVTLDANHQFASTHALNAIAMIGMDSPEIQEEVKALYARNDNKDRYDYRAINYLFKKWGIVVDE